MSVLFVLYQLMPQITPTHSSRLTPEISPKINLNGAELVMTPLILGLEAKDTQIDAIELEGFSLQAEVKPKSQKSKQNSKIQKKTSQMRFANRPRLNSTWHFFENELEKIIEEEKCSGNQQKQVYSEDQYDFCNQYSSESVIDSLPDSNTDKLDDKHSTTNIMPNPIIVQPSIPIQWQLANPKADLLNQLQKIDIHTQPVDQKLQSFKQTIHKYITEFQSYYFEDSMNRIFSIVYQTEADKIKTIKNILFSGINQTFNRKIGGLSFQKRRIKLLKYMDKKKRRVWQKKVNYDCRKKVADCRLRIKGKFVTLGQACGQLGISQKQGGTSTDVKALLERSTTKIQ